MHRCLRLDMDYHHLLGAPVYIANTDVCKCIVARKKSQPINN